MNRKTAIITGALGSLGQATTQQFLQQGFRVVGLDRPEIVEQAEAATEQVVYHGLDLSDAAATHSLLSTIETPITAGAMLAGGFSMGTLAETTLDKIKEMMAINFDTAYNATQALMPRMAEGGKLIYIGAKPALQPQAGQHMIAYSLSKSLLFQLADLVNEQGQERGISASVVVPSIIDTPANREAMPEAQFTDWVRPEEIGQMIAYLCSDAGRAIRDTTIKMYANS